MRLLILVFSIFFFSQLLRAQEKAPADSARFYKRIQSYSEQRKFTWFVYRLFFRPIREEEKNVPVKGVPSPDYRKVEGKVIRNIRIETVDPFCYRLNDTAMKTCSFPERVGNALHLKSLPVSIRNRLIIKKYDTFDSLRVKESMRLLRSQNYLREVFLFPVAVKGTDSVDILIRTFDVWSIIATGVVSKSNFRVNVKEKNFAGLGHQLQNDYFLDHSTGNFTNSTDYYFSNILNTYINAHLHYDTDLAKNYNASFSLDRPFYSIFTKWAGGAYMQDHLHHMAMLGDDSTQYNQNIRYLNQDYWLGKSWQLFRGRLEDERTTSLMLCGRISRRDHYERMAEELDTLRQFRNETFYLSSLSLVKRRYKQDAFIFKFGYTEDVPLGRAFSVIAGLQRREGLDRYYVGAKTFWGSCYDFGYLALNMEYGTFYKRCPQESAFNAGLTYFTNIGTWGRWRFRQFVKPQLTVGFNREKTDRLSLNNETGIRGFNSPEAFGTQKCYITFQTQAYAPWNLLGFRLGPYLVLSAGMLGTEKSGFRKSPLYTQYGIGVLIRNDFLVMNSFEISFAYFPYVPGVGDNIFRSNPFRSTDVGFRDSDIGKPGVVVYR